mmetsp:Transcript_3514/g.8205  ORF Transcript_3514/g.8205 Transcript_3514/m.8205 type:complete len:301 (+) Transcript_3514:1384-2286(+)
MLDIHHRLPVFAHVLMNEIARLLQAKSVVVEAVGAVLVVGSSWLRHRGLCGSVVHGAIADAAAALAACNHRAQFASPEFETRRAHDMIALCSDQRLHIHVATLDASRPHARNSLRLDRRRTQSFHELRPCALERASGVDEAPVGVWLCFVFDLLVRVRDPEGQVTRLGLAPLLPKLQAPDLLPNRKAKQALALLLCLLVPLQNPGIDEFAHLFFVLSFEGYVANCVLLVCAILLAGGVRDPTILPVETNPHHLIFPRTPHNLSQDGLCVVLVQDPFQIRIVVAFSKDLPWIVIGQALRRK